MEDKIEEVTTIVRDARYNTDWTLKPSEEVAKQICQIFDKKCAEEKAEFGCSVHEAAVALCEAECQARIEALIGWLGIWENELGFCEISNHLSFCDWLELKATHTSKSGTMPDKE